MIDDALDGAYAHEQEYGYTETGDLGHVGYSDDGDAVKLAHALNYVATNLNDLGTAEEKIAELELFSEMMKEASGEATATATEDAAKKAGDTFGDYWKNLKGDSGMGAGKAWENLSTGRKWALGGGAGLVGLGALYGGYKMLGGGDSPQNNVVKVSSLQGAKMRAFEKVAQRYDIPVWELEKLATSPMLERMLGENRGGLAGIQSVDGLSDDALAAAERRNAQIMQSRQRIATEYGAVGDGAKDNVTKAYEKLQKGEALTAAEKNRLLKYRRDNPLEANRAKFDKGVHTVEHGGTKYTVSAKYQNLSPEEIANRVNSGTIGQVDPDAMKGTAQDVQTAAQKQQQAGKQAREDRLAKREARKTQYRSAPSGTAADARATRKASTGTDLTLRRNLKADPRYMAMSSADRTLFDAAVRDAATGGTLNPQQERVLKHIYGDQYMTGVNADIHGTYERQSKVTQRGATRTNRAPNAQSVELQRAKNTASGASSAAGNTAAKTEAKELGFFAKNRRGLMAAGGLGAAGLAGYGLYRAMSGGQSKAAAFRGFQKIAEDRINPARIRAGAAHNFSGFDIRSHGGGESRFDPVSLRAARVRAKINSDMGSYVSNVGGGYNLERYLNRFNR